MLRLSKFQSENVAAEILINKPNKQTNKDISRINSSKTKKIYKRKNRTHNQWQTNKWYFETWKQHNRAKKCNSKYRNMIAKSKTDNHNKSKETAVKQNHNFLLFFYAMAHLETCSKQKNTEQTNTRIQVCCCVHRVSYLSLFSCKLFCVFAFHCCLCGLLSYSVVLVVVVVAVC